MRTPTLQRAGCLTAIVLLVAAAALASPAAAKKDEGYFQVRLANGMLACAVGSPLLATDNVCPSVIAFDRSSFDLEVPEGADVAILELRWTPNTALGGRTLSLTSAGSLEGDGEQRVEGPSVLRMTIKAATPGGSPAGTIDARVGASHDLSLVLQQTFQIAFTVFVDVEPPAGYSAFP